MRHFLEPVRAGAAVAVDEADRRARADRRAGRQDRGAVRRAGRRPVGARARAAARRLPRRAAPGAARRANGAGETLAAWERGLLGRRPPRVRPPASCACTAARVPADWVDYNGHVHESRYLQLFADATDALLAAIGVDADYLAAGGSYFTVETHLSHLRQLARGRRAYGDDAGARLPTRSACTSSTSLLRDGEAEPVATAEQMLLHVDTASGRAAPRRRRGARAGRRARRASTPRCRARSARAARIGAPVTRDLDAALRAAVGRDRRRLGRPGKWGYWFARDAAEGRAPAAACYLVGRSGGELLRAARAPSARRAARGAGARRPQRPGGALEQAVDESLAAGARGARRDRGRARRAGAGGRGARAGDRRAGARGRRGARRAELPRRLRRRGRARARLEPAAGAARSASSRRAGTSRSRRGCCSPTSASASRALVSVGNQADLDATELVAALAAHEATRVIGVYCEDFRDGRAFAEAARTAGKPVVLLTVGRTTAAGRAPRARTPAR